MGLDCGIAIDQALTNAVQWLRENYSQSLAIEWWDTIGKLESLDMADQFASTEERQETCELLNDLLGYIDVAKGEADFSTVEYLVTRIVAEIQEIRQEQAESYQGEGDQVTTLGTGSSIVSVSTSFFDGDDYILEPHEEYEFIGKLQFSSTTRGSAA